MLAQTNAILARATNLSAPGQPIKPDLLCYVGSMGREIALVTTYLSSRAAALACGSFQEKRPIVNVKR